MRKRKTNKVDKVFESIFVIIKDFVVIKNIEKILEDCPSLSNYIILHNCVNVVPSVSPPTQRVPL